MTETQVNIVAIGLLITIVFLIVKPLFFVWYIVTSIPVWVTALIIVWAVFTYIFISYMPKGVQGEG